MKVFSLLLVLSLAALNVGAFTMPRRNARMPPKSTSKLFYASDPYQVLGVSHDTDLEGIKAAYRTLAKEYHPGMLLCIVQCTRHCFCHCFSLTLNSVPPHSN